MRLRLTPERRLQELRLLNRKTPQLLVHCCLHVAVRDGRTFCSGDAGVITLTGSSSGTGEGEEARQAGRACSTHLHQGKLTGAAPRLVHHVRLGSILSSSCPHQEEVPASTRPFMPAEKKS